MSADDPVGWILDSDTLRSLLDQVKGGEDPEVVLIRAYSHGQVYGDAVEADVEAPDPLDIVTDWLEEAPGQGEWPWRDHCQGLAEGALTALVEDGWRIVRAKPLECPECGRWPDIGCTVDGALPTDHIDQAERIVEEWEPS